MDSDSDSSPVVLDSDSDLKDSDSDLVDSTTSLFIYHSNKPHKCVFKFGHSKLSG